METKERAATSTYMCYALVHIYECNSFSSIKCEKGASVNYIGCVLIKTVQRSTGFVMKKKTGEVNL